MADDRGGEEHDHVCEREATKRESLGPVGSAGRPGPMRAVIHPGALHLAAVLHLVSAVIHSGALHLAAVLHLMRSVPCRSRPLLTARICEGGSGGREEED
jgi:hypothetical protein